MILDYIENFELSEDALPQFFNELKSLQYLKVGLEFLYNRVRDIEVALIERINPNVRSFIMGNVPSIPGVSIPNMTEVPQDFIACCFHWYAISVCNYARMVGWLRHTSDSTSQTALRYVALVLPEVKSWRDKVAAHFAITGNDDRDTPAERAASVLYPIAFDDDAFYASPMTLTLSRGAKSSTSTALHRWSLTKTHKHLCQRYWPDSLR